MSAYFTTHYGLLFGAALLLGSLLFKYLKACQQGPYPLPPSPPGEPILGHLRVIPAVGPEHRYIEWSREYSSDILYFNVLGRPIIVLNSVKAAHDLLDKRGANYASRPRFVLFEV